MRKHIKESLQHINKKYLIPSNMDQISKNTMENVPKLTNAFPTTKSGSFVTNQIDDILPNKLIKV